MLTISNENINIESVHFIFVRNSFRFSLYKYSSSLIPKEENISEKFKSNAFFVYM